MPHLFYPVLFDSIILLYFAQDPWLFSILLERYKSPFPYVGVFLTRDRDGPDGTNQNTSTSSDSEKSSENKLLNRLHHIGTLAEVLEFLAKHILFHLLIF